MVVYGCIAPDGCERAGMKPYPYTGASRYVPKILKQGHPHDLYFGHPRRDRYHPAVAEICVFGAGVSRRIGSEPLSSSLLYRLRAGTLSARKVCDR